MPPKVDYVALTVSGDMSLGAKLGLVAQLEYALSVKKNLVTVPIPVSLLSSRERGTETDLRSPSAS